MQDLALELQRPGLRTLATLPADGPSGILWGHLWTPDGPPGAYGALPW